MPRAMDTIATEANRLYWETETPVAEIAQQLELSRRALYDSVDPLPTSSSCTVCGSPLVFENRSARNASIETCPSCEVHGPTAPRSEARKTTASEAPALGENGQRAIQIGAALAGAALGAIITLLVVPRR